MAKPYGNDFRQKVMQAIELDGLKKSEASQLLDTRDSQLIAPFTVPCVG